MKIGFRVDSSVQIGTGHVMRCLNLAHQLKKEGVTSFFICRPLEGNIINTIQASGFTVFSLSNTVKFDSEHDAAETLQIIDKARIQSIIVDHYEINHIWEVIVKSQIKKLYVIDDLANRKHSCNVLLDQNYYGNYENRYKGLVDRDTELILGPTGLILRDEFYSRKRYVREGTIKNLLVFYGGSDPTNETEKTLKALEMLTFQPISIHVVVGDANPKKEYIQSICMKNNYHYHQQINFLSELMETADLSLGAGGVTMWERCYLGLPSIVTIVAENQRMSSDAAFNYGAIMNLGWHEGVTSEKIADTLNEVIHHRDVLRRISEKSLSLINSENKQRHPLIQAIMEDLIT
ncbi:UDP-2,4-diacetamido-2,4,6-trideoxy-beta-L-altropyranose hydrolase [Bacillus sp. AK128]